MNLPLPHALEAPHRSDNLTGIIDETFDPDFSDAEAVLGDAMQVIRSIHKYSKKNGIRPPERAVDELDEISQETVLELLKAVDWSIGDDINPKYPRRAARMKEYLEEDIPVS